MFAPDEDLKKLFPPKQNIIDEIKDKDKKVIVADFENKITIISNTKYEELRKLNIVYEELNGLLVDFSLLPMYYELFFCIKYGMQDIDASLNYLRSLKTCMDKFDNLADELKKEEDILFFEKAKNNYPHYIELIKLEYNYSEYGRRDSNLKYYLPDEEEFISLTKREIAIRVLMRKGKLTRSQAYDFIDKHEKIRDTKKLNSLGI